MRMVRDLLVMGVIFGAAAIAFAAEAVQKPEAYAQAPAKHWHESDSDWMKAFHNPMEGLTMGLDLRLREVYTKNLFRVDDEAGDDYHWQRYRLRFSTKWALAEDIDFNTRLVWEFWGHCAPDGRATVNPFFSEKNYDFDEALFDNFNIQMRNAFDMPLTLTVGRQDIILGTGWLVLDGTPADGSRTIFFDAIRATYDLTETSKLDLIYIQQYDDEEQYIKPFNHGAVEDRRHLTQKQDEQGVILYYTNTGMKNLSYDAYFMYKEDEASDWSAAYSTPGVDAEIYTFGGRLFGQLDDNWSYTAEGAGQWGDRDGDDLCAFGTNNKLTYSFNDAKKSQVFVVYEFMTGDDPSTSTDEHFDTMWGDWPQSQRGGDLQSYLWTREGALGEVSNLQMVGVGHSFKPAEAWTMLTQYNLMWAVENEAAAAAAGAPYSNDGNFRGHMLTGLLTYQCCKAFKTQFLVDYFLPGNYYSTRDDAFFARVNMEWTF